jgi:stage III sporulation protein AD
MDALVKGAAVGVTAAVVGLALKKTSPEAALLLWTAAGVVILIGVFGTVAELTSFAQDIANTSGLSGELVTPVLKCTGIAIVSKMSSDVCRDAGASSAAGAVELAGAAAGIAVSIPLLKAVLDMIRSVV